MSHSGVFEHLANGVVGEVLESTGKASKCNGNKNHSPNPLRFVWHHILPQAAGGKTVVANLVSLCDNCHYGVHAILYDMARHEGKTPHFGRLSTTPRYALALAGYQAAVGAGTVAAIPNEGGGAD